MSIHMFSVSPVELPSVLILLESIVLLVSIPFKIIGSFILSFLVFSILFGIGFSILLDFFPTELCEELLLSDAIDLPLLVLTGFVS